MKRIVLALTLSVLVATNTYAATILVFGQTTGANTITGDETGGVTSITGVNVPVTITTLNSAGSNLPASFNFNATSIAPANNVGGNLWTQQYSGNFSVTNGGFNYLSGTFVGVDLGVNGGTTMIFGSTQPPLFLDFTSSVLGMPLDDPSAMALSFTNLLPGVTISNGSFGDFTSNVSGDFSATAVPEPASMILLGSGLLYVMRRKYKSQS
jgi:hypothetical protein